MDAGKGAARGASDLPFAAALQPFDGALRPEGDYAAVHVDGLSFEGADASRARFLECTFSSAAAIDTRLRAARFADVWWHASRLVGVDLAESTWLDANLVSCALAGVEFYGGELRRVTFTGCKFDSVNLRGSLLRDVAFVDCLLRDVDLGDATLTAVTFRGCELDNPRFTRATMRDVDLRGAAFAGKVEGIEGISGATVSTRQALELAPVLAAAMGIIVVED
jgi:uncharacterized protein YjbI with pentapeptide repeats